MNADDRIKLDSSLSKNLMIRAKKFHNFAPVNIRCKCAVNIKNDNTLFALEFESEIFIFIVRDEDLRVFVKNNKALKSSDKWKEATKLWSERMKDFHCFCSCIKTASISTVSTV